MKNTRWSILFFCFFLMISLWYVNQQSGEKHIDERKPSTDVRHYPNEWMYNQRAYPSGEINRKAMTTAWQARTERIKNGVKSIGSWELEGPINIGGRITDIAISALDDNVFYIGAATGGIFKTTDRGESWTSIFETGGRPFIGDITLAPSNPERIYVGTGEANASATSGAFIGDGVYRSDDGGNSWVSIGLPESEHISRIVVDPQDENRLFVAASGILYGHNSERGVYRSLDGGSNWDQVLYLTDSTACIDIVMHPTNTDTLYAAMWERTRQAWARDYGGVSSGVHRSTDGGDTWELLGNGLPLSDEDTGRIGLAISKSEPNVVYASYTSNSITNTFAGLYRSEDDGDTWTEITGGAIEDANASFGWYFGNVRVNPTNSDDVHVLGQLLYRTAPTGSGWVQDQQMHVDFHALEYSSINPEMVLCGTDGGLYISEDMGINWEHYENLPITQLYQIEVDESDPAQIYAGAQDNNTLRTTTGALNDFEAILGGDGFHVNVDPTDNSYVYAEYQFGNLFRSEENGLNMNPAIDDISSSDRTNWNTPVIMSPINPNVLYYGSNILYRSEDQALSWEPISGDLTQGQHPSGSQSYGTLTTLAASSLNEGVIYTGSDDGRVHVTFDTGETWADISEGLPNRYVTGLAIHPGDDMTCYVSFSGFKDRDFEGHVYKTSDGGSTWSALNEGLPGIPVNDILIQPEPFRLIVATDMDVRFSDDDGQTWDVLGDDLPPTSMTHLQYHEPTKRLFVGTFGRSIYSFDLLQLSPDDLFEYYTTEQISVYPNPSSDYITLTESMSSEKNVSWKVLDLKGAVMLCGSTGELTHGRINTTSLATGTYLLRIESTPILVSKFQIVNN